MPDKNPTNLLHTPSDGFVDIKPLAGSSNLAKDVLQYSAYCIVFFIIFYIFWLIFTKMKNKEILLTKLSPIEEFKEDADFLGNSNANIREFSEKLSLALRRYCDRALFKEHKVCETLTSKEIKQVISHKIQKHFPILPSQKKKNIHEELIIILKQLEEIEYGDEPSKSDSKEFRESLLKNAREWVSTLDTELIREFKRTQLITDSAKQNYKNTKTSKSDSIRGSVN
ncbi:MAG TPA: hypothetical protein PKA63_10210 [Oligoflexia bacterium]|nr:hypothetical protein [Oligoflexia bacterium]HMP49030.1 hypothetical protein [Oligoflexia bacterium]